MTDRRHGIIALLAALALNAVSAHAQLTGGRVGGSNWGAAAPSPPPAPSPSPMVAAPMAPPPAPMAPPPAPMIPAPAPMIPAPPPPPAPPAPPPQRIFVHQWRRGTPSPGDQVVAARERSADDAERRAASPSWSAGTVSGPPRFGVGAIAGLFTFAGLFGLTLLLTRRRPRVPGPITTYSPAGGYGAAPPPRTPSVRPAQHPGVELRMVSVAFDWTARAQIQQQLAALASRVDTSTPPGLHALACAARDLLAGAHRAARYGVFQSFATDLSQAQPFFTQLADRARSRYTVETVTNAQRVMGPAVSARAEEGGGLVVVTLLVASNGPLPQLPVTMDVPSVMHALQEAVPPRAERLLAVELVWSPASESDRMSSAELAALYPELLKLDPTAALGRRACGHCHAVYAMELGRCPACGAG